jgi:hypothetical protein
MSRFQAVLSYPLGEQEQRARLLLLIAGVLVASTLLLTKTSPASHRPAPRSREGTKAQPPAPSAVHLSPAAARVSAVFLKGYLPFIYGHGPAGAVKDATAELTRSLRAHPPRVSPAMRAAHPRLLSLHATAATGRIAVTALVNDGGVTDYPITLVLSSVSGRLRISALGAR